MFAGYGDDLKPEDVLDVAAYVAERTYGEGDADSYRHMEGDPELGDRYGYSVHRTTQCTHP